MCKQQQQQQCAFACAQTLILPQNGKRIRDREEKAVNELTVYVHTYSPAWP